MAILVAVAIVMGYGASGSHSLHAKARHTTEAYLVKAFGRRDGTTYLNLGRDPRTLEVWKVTATSATRIVRSKLNHGVDGLTLVGNKIILITAQGGYDVLARLRGPHHVELLRGSEFAEASYMRGDSSGRFMTVQRQNYTRGTPGSLWLTDQWGGKAQMVVAFRRNEAWYPDSFGPHETLIYTLFKDDAHGETSTTFIRQNGISRELIAASQILSVESDSRAYGVAVTTLHQGLYVQKWLPGGDLSAAVHVPKPWSAAVTWVGRNRDQLLVMHFTMEKTKQCATRIQIGLWDPRHPDTVQPRGSLPPDSCVAQYAWSPNS